MMVAFTLSRRNRNPFTVLTHIIHRPNLTHTLMESRMDALEKLPAYSPESCKESVAKTGTFDIPESVKSADRPGDSFGGEAMPSFATTYDDSKRNNQGNSVSSIMPGKKINPADSRSCGVFEKWHPHGESNPGRQLEKLVS